MERTDNLSRSEDVINRDRGTHRGGGIQSGVLSRSYRNRSNRYLIDFARERGAHFVLRGIRTESDYEYERAMRNINGDLAPGVTTVFLMPPREIAEVSSSLVKSLVGPAGWEDVVRKYVPDAVHAKLVEAVRARA